MPHQDIQDYIRFYFSLGLNHKEILVSLAHFNGVIVSLRTLRRILSEINLHRRKSYSDILDVSLYLTEQTQNSNGLHGYKLMHLKCIQEGFVVKQETIRLLLQIIDPEGVAHRKKRRIRRRRYYNNGPNFCWHIDSYDKLSPYGICINGAIDGFSRLIIWLKAFNTNSDPRVVAGYFIRAVEDKRGCPGRIRVDLGTENGHMCQMQSAMRWNNPDCYARNSVIYGSSIHNQRIECWWGFLRNHMAQFWMNLFHDLKDNDLFSGDFLDKNLVQFVFMNLIQAELDQVSKLWNMHRIRPTRNAVAAHGRPMSMYFLPHLYEADDHLCPVTADQYRTCQEYCRSAGPYPCDQTVFDICCTIMAEYNWNPPCCPDEGRRLYRQLRSKILINL